MPPELTLHEIECLQELGTQEYQRRILGLFMSHRATQTHWNALGHALLFLSESVDADLVAAFSPLMLTGTCMPLCRRYRARVRALFREGRATADQWDALGAALLHVSESSEGYLLTSVDRAVLASVQQSRQEMARRR